MIGGINMRRLSALNNIIKVMMAICLLVAIIFSSGVNVYASPKEDTEAALRATKGDYYADQWVRWQDMMDNYIEYDYDNIGLYKVSKTKLYAREIVGMYEDGSYIIGPWKLVHTNDGEKEKFRIPGDCVMFAFSFDIFWGTDYPYSGVFWNNPDTRVNKIKIYSWGEARTAGLTINVNKKTIYDEYNLSSHKEWKP